MSLLPLLLLGLAGCAPAQTANNVEPLTKVLQAAAGAYAPTATQILFQGCSEIDSCAQGCAPVLSACAGVDVDEAQRATLLASCGGLDFRDKRAADSTVTPEAWIRQHLGAQIDALPASVSAEDRARLEKLREAVSL